LSGKILYLVRKKFIETVHEKSIEMLAELIPQNTLLKRFIETFCGKNNSFRHCVKKHYAACSIKCDLAFL
jgi:hypothetical protein